MPMAASSQPVGLRGRRRATTSPTAGNGAAAMSGSAGDPCRDSTSSGTTAMASARAAMPSARTAIRDLVTAAGVPARPGLPMLVTVRPERSGNVTESAGRVVVAHGVLSELLRTAFRAVLVGLQRLVLCGDRRDLPGQFAAVKGSRVGRDVERGDRPHPAFGH